MRVNDDNQLKHNQQLVLCSIVSPCRFLTPHVAALQCQTTNTAGTLPPPQQQRLPNHDGWDAGRGDSENGKHAVVKTTATADEKMSLLGRVLVAKARFTRRNSPSKEDLRQRYGRYQQRSTFHSFLYHGFVPLAWWGLVSGLFPLSVATTKDNEMNNNKGTHQRRRRRRQGCSFAAMMEQAAASSRLLRLRRRDADAAVEDGNGSRRYSSSAGDLHAATDANKGGKVDRTSSATAAGAGTPDADGPVRRSSNSSSIKGNRPSRLRGVTLSFSWLSIKSLYCCAVVVLCVYLSVRTALLYADPAMDCYEKYDANLSMSSPMSKFDRAVFASTVRNILSTMCYVHLLI